LDSIKGDPIAHDNFGRASRLGTASVIAGGDNAAKVRYAKA